MVANKDADAPDLEAGRLLFAAECRFVAAAARIEQVPVLRLPEVAFAGRSNVGKSSLVNALTGRTTLARVSQTPGRTRQLNFFEVGKRLVLVDLPGYGYARAPKHEVQAWTGLMRDYVRGRPGLRRVCILIDARHGTKPADLELMDLLGEAAVVFQLVLTKCDKIGAAEALERRQEFEALSKRAALHPVLLETSARTGDGIEAMRAELAALALAKPIA